MVKKAEEDKKAPQVVQGEPQQAQAEENTQSAPGAATPEAAAAAGGENGQDVSKTDAEAVTPEGSATTQETGDVAKDATSKPDDAPPQSVLETLSVLADRHRIASWQQAALMRCMGWEAGKMVTDAEYRGALERVRSRPMGGGRLA